MHTSNTWALAIALPYGRVGICEILQAADKALEQRLSFNMFAAWSFDQTALQKYRKFGLGKKKETNLTKSLFQIHVRFVSLIP